MPKIVEPEMVEVRMRSDVAANFHEYYDVKRGQAVTIPARDALRYYVTDLVEPLNAADETPEDRKARMDRARQYVRELGNEMQKAAREPYEEAMRAVAAANDADKKRRIGWH